MNDENCQECGEDWTAHTLRINRLGKFYSECGRSKKDGPDPFMKLLWDLEVAKELTAKLRADNAAELARTKRECQDAIAATQKELAETKIALQSAEARVRDVDAIIAAETRNLQKRLETAHQAELDERLAIKDAAHEEVLAGRRRVFDELKARYDTLVKQLADAATRTTTQDDRIASLEASLTSLRASIDAVCDDHNKRYKKLLEVNKSEATARALAEEAQDKAKVALAEAERKLGLALTGQDLAEDEAKRVADENQRLKLLLRQYMDLHGPLPGDVVEEAAPPEAMPIIEATKKTPSTPEDQPPSDDEDFMALLDELRRSREPDQKDPEEGGSDGFRQSGTDPSIDLGDHPSMLMDTSDDGSANDHDDEHMSRLCAAYGGCSNPPTMTLKLQFEGDEFKPIVLSVCEEHERDRRALLTHLERTHGISIDNPDELDGRFHPINNPEETKMEDSHA